MKCLAARVWPTFGHDGDRLKGWRKDKAGGPMRFGAALLAKCGGWAWHKQVLGMRGWMETRCCWLCEATLADRDFSANASHRCTEHTHSGWICEMLAGKAYASKLFDVIGFRITHVKPDWMHTVCLGTLQYVCGNVLWQIFVVCGGTHYKPLAACSMLYNMTIMAARDLEMEVPIVTLTVGMFRVSGKKPKLKLKASEGRRFLQILTRFGRQVLPTCQ